MTIQPYLTFKSKDAPTLYVYDDGDWETLLDNENVNAWYHVHKTLSPGAFSRGDNVDGATVGDAIWCKLSVYKAAMLNEKWALRLLCHEYLHCMTDWTPTLEQLNRLEHPNTAIDAVIHAWRNDWPINAFSRIFRWHDEPHTEWIEFLAWFKVLTRPVPS